MIIWVMLLYSDISNSIFWSVNILKSKKFLIGFLNELEIFKQIFFTFQNAKFCYILQQWTHDAYLICALFSNIHSTVQSQGVTFASSWFSKNEEAIEFSFLTQLKQYWSIFLWDELRTNVDLVGTGLTRKLLTK